MASHIPTQCIVISDTHGDELDYQHLEVDVAIHCGDLTEESKIDEFRSSIQLLKSIKAPLKLVIAGNHDWTMDVPTFKKKLADIPSPVDEEVVRKSYGGFGEARQLFGSDDAKAAGIVFLEEGTHHFKLKNKAVLTVYASPFTPSLSEWGFQYPPEDGHDYRIGQDVDIAITHGPPRGIFDYADSKKRYGCPNLFTAVARARPKMHCFGHMHAQWGAKMITWKSELHEPVSHFTAIDNDRSVVVETLAGVHAKKYDSADVVEEKTKKAAKLEREGCCKIEETPEPGKQTLFVNAAIEGTEEHPHQVPWIVQIPLLPG
ncbi:ser Thr phosphatase family [Lecanosticta acicola]|uniref:Ser Thr phosphatase family n=1 Tax=Lecanosticta acicola TaxID=111012 RepID=A0AAI9E9V3_9PEZI|nr:ser Thr phosphatase family [Lecanosticta acicola]